MLRSKRVIFIIMAMLCIISALSSHKAFADNNYPLEQDEKLIEERYIDEAYTDIFTSRNNIMYLKRLKRIKNGWIIIDTQELSPKWTGLITADTESHSSKDLAGILNTGLKQYGINSESLPASIDHSGSEYLPPVGEQNENSCVGWAIGYYLRSYQQAKDLLWPVKTNDHILPEHVFSPTFIYNQINDGRDYGATLNDAAQLVKQTGAATLDVFPYISGDYYTRPSQDSIERAYPHRVREWNRLYSKSDTTDQEIIQRIKAYLNTGDLVVAGNSIGFGFYYPHRDHGGRSIITVEKNAPYKHAFVIVGYDDTFASSDGYGAFKLLNSWGKDWGDQGFSYISYKAFTVNTIEGFVFTDLINNLQQHILLNVYDSVTFNIDFSSPCTYDYVIIDPDSSLVYEARDNQGSPGSNSITWNGKRIDGAVAENGEYNMIIQPYKNGVPAKPFQLSFEKISKVDSISCNTVINDYVIESIDIPISFNTDCMLDIDLEYNGLIYELVSNQSISAGDSNVYTIEKTTFDFNGKDLDKIRIIVDLR